jgi:putative peptidoglycan lipid II flippase
MKSLTRAVGVVVILTIFSRLMALLNQMIYLGKFGVTAQMDAYSFAISIPNIVFVGIGTALTTVVVPIFANHFEQGEKERGFAFVRNITTLSVLSTAFIAILGVIFSPMLIGFTHFSRGEVSLFAIFATRIMFAVMMFYAITYIFQGVLQSTGRFVASSMVSLPGSLVVIAYVIFFGNRFGMTGLIFATLIGLSFQVMIMVPSMWKVGFDFKPALDLKNGDLRKALKLIPPIFIGTSAWQVNMLFNSTMAARYVGGATLINLVQNLITSGVLTFIYSITAVIFPKFTILYGSGKLEEFKSLFLKSIRTVLFFLIPLGIGFMLLGKELLDLVYGRGEVTQSNIDMAAIIMGFYAVGIIGHSIKEIVDRAFYAMKDTLRPAINGLIIMVVNIVSCLVLVIPFGVYGIPFGYSISLSVGGVLILLTFSLRIGKWGGVALLKSLGKIFLSSLLMGIGVIFVKSLLQDLDTGSALLDKLLVFFMPTSIGIIVYFMGALLLKIGEAQEVLGKLKSKLGRSGS